MTGAGICSTIRQDQVFRQLPGVAHAVGRDGRRAALAGMAGVLKPGGSLTLTSRNWEDVRRAGTRVDVWDRLVERGGRKAVVAYSWQIPPFWEAEHGLEISVAQLQEADRLRVTRERLALWPFSHADLLSDLEAAGLRLLGSSYDPASPSDYVVTAGRPASAAGSGVSPDRGE